MLELLIKIVNTLKFLPFLFFKSKSLDYLLFPNFYFPRIIKIDIRNVALITSIKKRRYFKNIFQNFDLGNLTDVNEMFITCPKFITANQILKDKNKNIEELAEYNFHITNLNKKGSTRGFKTNDMARIDIINRIEFYNRLSRTGYQKQYTPLLNELNEIHLGLSCDSFIKVNAGNHRFAAYLLLGMNEIYASLVSIHSSVLFKYKSKFAFITVFKIRKLIEKLSI